MKRKYVFLNLAASLGSQLAGIVISLIIPKLLIETYGSAMNGLVSTAARIAGYFVIVQGGVAAATGVYLYRALAEGDHKRINGIFSATHSFFVKTGIWLGIAASVFALSFSWSFHGRDEYWTAVAICSMSFSVVVVGYVFFFKYNMIVDADQKSYLVVNSLIVGNSLAAAIQVFLIVNEAHILLVVAVPFVIGILRLVLTRSFIRRYYSFLSLRVVPCHDALRHKWDSLAISMSRLLKFVLPAVYTSMFIGFEYASIFVIYAIIFNIGSSIMEMSVQTLSGTMGRLAATSHRNRLRNIYEAVSSGSMYGAAALSVCFLVLFHSFIGIYIGPSPDVSYWLPVLMVSFVANEFVNNIRFAPNLLVRACGHIKQTSRSAVIELAIAVTLTPLGVVAFGFQGVLLGCILSSFYRTMFLEWYCRRVMLGVSVRRFVYRFVGLLLYVACMAGVLLAVIPNAGEVGRWLVSAVVVTVMASVSAILLFAMLDRSSLSLLLRFFGSSARPS